MSANNAWIWIPVMANAHGFTYATAAEARESDETDVTISIVRGSAAPIGGGRLGRLPGTYRSGDIAHEWDVELDHGTDDDPISLETRWEQAQAMAAGLNAADDRCSARSEDGMNNETAALRALEAAVLRSLLAREYGDDSDPHGDAKAVMAAALGLLAAVPPGQQVVSKAEAGKAVLSRALEWREWYERNRSADISSDEELALATAVDALISAAGGR